MKSRAIHDLAAKYGCTVLPTGGGHLKLRHPSGWFVFTASTPGDRRALKNVEAQLRRARYGR